MYMDDVKIFAKNKTELENLVHTVRMFSQDIRMELGIEKCATKKKKEKQQKK